MTNRRSVFRLTRTQCAFFFFATAWQAHAQTPVTPPPAPPIVNSQHLEVEAVEVHDLIGLPAQITRKAGPFILVVTNKSKDPAAWFVVDVAPVTAISALPAAAASAVTVVAHLLTIGSGQYDPKHRSGVLFEAVAGTYQLKFGVTGQGICTIVIQ